MEWIGEWNAWLAGRLAGPEFGLQSALLLWAGGIVAALLPCVYPLYPITASILRERGGQSGWRSAAHPAAYYLGLSLVYGSFGVVAALSGGAFNEALRWPSVNLAIAVVIFLLGLSSMELLHLPFFRGFDGARAPGGLGGSLLFGAAAGLLSSPCVGPVVVTVLINLAAGAGAVSLSSTLGAAARMTIFGLGVGLPLFLTGVFGMRLPRSGRWMRWVQIALGLLVIYFAGTYYFKAMAAWRIETGPALAIAALSMLALAAGILLQRREIALHVRTLRSLPAGLVVLAAAVALHLSGWIGAPQPPQLPPERIGNLLWLRDRDQAFGQARESGRLLFVDFFAEWCSNCHAFQETVQENQALNQALQSAVLYKVDDRDPVFQSFQEDPRFPELLIGLPFFVIFDAEGNVLYQTTNYLASAEMIAHLKQNVAPPPSVERR